MPEDDDLYARTDWLAEQLKHAGFPEIADRLSHLVHGVAWTTSSELIGELGVALLSIRRLHSAELQSVVLVQLDAAIALVREFWPDIAEPEPATACSGCERVGDRIDIRLPGQLRSVLHAVRELVEAGSLRVLPQPEGEPHGRSFLALSHEGPWPDVLSYRFQCNRCQRYFALSAETYHGSGGEWRPQL